MESQVLRPMMTALRTASEDAAVVVFLKNAMSPGRRHGSSPARPMPRLGAAATMTEKRRMAIDEIEKCC
jgi:hypothetical protein